MLHIEGSVEEGDGDCRSAHLPVVTGNARHWFTPVMVDVNSSVAARVSKTMCSRRLWVYGIYVSSAKEKDAVRHADLAFVFSFFFEQQILFLIIRPLARR